MGEIVDGFGECLQPENRERKEDGKMMESKTQPGPKSGMKACLDL